MHELMRSACEVFGKQVWLREETAFENQIIGLVAILVRVGVRQIC